MSYTRHAAGDLFLQTPVGPNAHPALPVRTKPPSFVSEMIDAAELYGG